MSPDTPGFGDLLARRGEFSVSSFAPGLGDLDDLDDRRLPSMVIPGDLGASSNSVAPLSTSTLFRPGFGDLDDGRFSELDDFGDFLVPISPVDARREGVFGDFEWSGSRRRSDS